MTPNPVLFLKSRLLWQVATQADAVQHLEDDDEQDQP
jgi:hypothetical protein